MTDSDYDGISFDWEGNINYAQVRQLVIALRNALPSGKLLTATGIDNNSSIAGWSQGSPATYTYLDRFADMTYDWVATWEPDWLELRPACRQFVPQRSCGANWDDSITHFTNAGWPLSKVNMGIPFYGYSVSVSQAPASAPLATASIKSPIPPFSGTMAQIQPAKSTTVCLTSPGFRMPVAM